MLILAWKRRQRQVGNGIPALSGMALRIGKRKKVTVPTPNGGKSLRAPQKIILLGDLLELWEPQSGNLITPFRDSFTPFNALLTLSHGYNTLSILAHVL